MINQEEWFLDLVDVRGQQLSDPSFQAQLWEKMGFGESKPMMDGRSEVANRRNRRVELELVP